MHNLMKTVSGLGRRLADAGREARQASTTTGAEVIDQLTSALGAAAGEVVRAAAVGAVAAIVHGARTTARQPMAPVADPWEALDDFRIEPGDELANDQPVSDMPSEPSSPLRPRWVAGVRAMGSALTVAAGAAAACPGGRIVAAGLGAAAAVAGLAARAGETPSA